MKRFLLAWVNHAALNIGAAIACCWYAAVPPQWTGHSEKTCSSLARDLPWTAFWKGLSE